MGRKRTSFTRQSGQLRELLLEHHRRRIGPDSRWHVPGIIDQYQQALTSSTAVVIPSEALLTAMMAAGRPAAEYRQIIYGGPYCGKQLHLDVDDTLSEWTAGDECRRHPG